MMMMGLRRLALLAVVALAACKVPNANKVAGDAAPACGDHVVDPGEVCDDGNTVSGDGCSADCLSDETCGNGVMDPGEQCDDGNTIACDGCSADCHSDETCGNGVTDTCKGETCDDGNNRSGDGCSSTCQSNEMCGNGTVDAAAGEECDTSGVETATCEVDCKHPVCGDNIKNVLAGEECDDGNTTSGDGCDDKCRLEQCGNGRLEDNEQCDDANTANDDACVNCRFATCGDFYVQKKPAPPAEQCDEGPTPSLHGACPTMCKSAFCGDAYVWNIEGGNEQCDDGTNSLTGACPACQTARCGDGYVYAGHEQCDEGQNPSAHGACPSRNNGNQPTCKSAYCGDKYVWNIEGGNEQCDDGTNALSGACPACRNAVCGDGHLYVGVEQCDTGGTDTSSCNAGTCKTPMCGDMYVNAAANEQCDLGVNNSDTGACLTNCQNATCGDGHVYTGVEDCDTGAGNPDTGNCNGGTCKTSMCGDSYINGVAGEQCDDGNQNGVDGICDANCQCVSGGPTC